MPKRIEGNCVETIQTILNEKEDRIDYILCGRRINTKKTMKLRKVYGFDHENNDRCVKHLMKKIKHMNGIPEEEMKEILTL